MSLWDTVLEMQEKLIKLQPQNYTENIKNLENILANLGMKKYFDKVDYLKLIAKKEYENCKNK